MITALAAGGGFFVGVMAGGCFVALYLSHLVGKWGK